MCIIDLNKCYKIKKYSDSTVSTMMMMVMAIMNKQTKPDECSNGVTKNGYPQLKQYQKMAMLVPQFDGD